MHRPFLKKVTLRNYKSIAFCELDLTELIFLVGPNGSGKSNFLDSLRFVSDSLKSSLDHALRDRGTIKEVRRRSGGHPNHFSIRLDFDLNGVTAGHFSFRVGAKKAGGFEVQNEECVIRPSNAVWSAPEHFYHVESGKVIDASFEPRPVTLPDRLFLVAVSGLSQFRPIYDALSRMEVYNLNPKKIGDMQKPDPGDLLRRDGSNLVSVFQRLPVEVHKKINGYLSRIVSGVSEAGPRILGSQETMEFKQTVKGQAHPWRFLASSMSDGTLRALGILVAIFQGLKDDPSIPLLVGLEEPEIALHPGGASVLLAALREGSRHAQVIVTSHSPELLDNDDIPAEALRAVENVEGITRIGTIDAAGKEVLKKHLYTPGELLRQNQIAVDPTSLFEVTDERQLKIFELSKS